MGPTIKGRLSHLTSVKRVAVLYAWNLELNEAVRANAGMNSPALHAGGPNSVSFEAELYASEIGPLAMRVASGRPLRGNLAVCSSKLRELSKPNIETLYADPIHIPFIRYIESLEMLRLALIEFCDRDEAP